MIAFSTANPEAASLTDDTKTEGTRMVEMLSNAALNPVFDAAIFATEAAILNALVAAETMTGIDDATFEALPHDRVRELLARYGRG